MNNVVCACDINIMLNLKIIVLVSMVTGLGYLLVTSLGLFMPDIMYCTLNSITYHTKFDVNILFLYLLLC